MKSLIYRKRIDEMLSSKQRRIQPIINKKDIKSRKEGLAMGALRDIYELREQRDEYNKRTLEKVLSI